MIINFLFMNNLFRVVSVRSWETYEWLLYKHYARRIPSISYSFGLFDAENIMQGVITFGKPASPSLCIGVCGEDFSEYVYELNRLCVNDGLPKNSLSYFVSSSLKLLPNMIIVSYSDMGQNHHGYIYQATNWIYTGQTKERTDIGMDDGSHSRHYDKKLNYSLNRKKRTSKHRYIYFVGDKKFVNSVKKKLKYPIMPYPKGENKRYDASYKPSIQTKIW